MSLMENADVWTLKAAAQTNKYAKNDYIVVGGLEKSFWGHATFVQL